MKKLLAAVAFLLFALQVPAQVFVAGSVGFDMSSYTKTAGFDPTKPKGMALQLSPQVGFNVSPAVKLGAMLSIANQKYTYTNGYYDRTYNRWQETEQTVKTLMTAGGGVFVRVRCFEARDFSVGLELSAVLSYGLGATRDTQYYSQDLFPVRYETKFNTRQFDVRLVPMATYRLSERLGVDVYVDMLSIVFTHSIVDQYKKMEVMPWQTEAESELDYSTATSDFHAGFNSLTSRLVSIGLSYTF